MGSRFESCHNYGMAFEAWGSTPLLALNWVSILGSGVPCRGWPGGAVQWFLDLRATSLARFLSWSSAGVWMMTKPALDLPKPLGVAAHLSPAAPSHPCLRCGSWQGRLGFFTLRILRFTPVGMNAATHRKQTGDRFATTIGHIGERQWK